MINDSVREELVGKIFNNHKMPESRLKEDSAMSNKIIQTDEDETAHESASCEPAPTPKTATTEITTKITSPTLVEFHNRNTTIPEWRLQLQNVVRQRQEREIVGAETEVSLPPQRAQLITSGANALKVETVAAPKVVQHKNPTLSSALERIEKSRRQFLVEEKPSFAQSGAPAKTGKNFPFYIAAKTNDVTAKPAEVNPPISSFAKPKLATTPKPEKEKLDTNKLPSLPKTVEVSAKLETKTVTLEAVNPKIEEVGKIKIEEVETIKTEIKIIETTPTDVKTSTEIIENEEIEVEEFDDCAPFGLRFNAGLFDLIIGSFTSLFLLAPFMLLGGDWLSAAGIFAFLATSAVVMFVYMTTAVGLYGRTFGMRLFSLEIVDIETEDYPSFHQAAVSSAVYLLSLALVGAGFLTVPFNEDKRAIHDLVSGTLIIKE